MKRRRTAARIPSGRPATAGEGDTPPLIELERFSRASLQRWRTAERQLRELNRSFFYDLERQRQQHSAELIEALRSRAIRGAPFAHWARIIDYRYSNAPLSVVGSLRRDGGRFNIGVGLDPAAFTPFPALYIAEDYDTALRERFGPREPHNSLETHELALRDPGSFTHVSLRGQVEQIIDVSDLDALRPFAAVLALFEMPPRVVSLARQLRLGARAAEVRPTRSPTLSYQG